MCAGGIYFLFGKLEKRKWKILTFAGVWVLGFILTVLVGIFVSSELYDGDFSVMQRYLGNSIFMPMAGCLLGVFARKVKSKKADTKNMTAYLLLFLLPILSACGTVQLESRLAPEGIGNIGSVYVQAPESTTIPDQSFDEALKSNLTEKGYTITSRKSGADYIMVYEIEDIITQVGGSYVLPSYQTTSGYVGQDRVSLTTRENTVQDWGVDIPETIVRAKFKRGEKILWEGGMLIRQEAFDANPTALASRFMTAFGKEVNSTEPLN
jgi:hypothetical protein